MALSYLFHHKSGGLLVFAPAFVLDSAVVQAWVRTSGAFSDRGLSDCPEQVVGQFGAAGDAPYRGCSERLADQGQGGQEAEVDGMLFGLCGGFGHLPSKQVAEDELGVDFLEDAPGRAGAKILDVQAVFPFSIDGFHGPPAMVQVHQFVPRAQIAVHERGKQPAGAEPAALIANEPADDLFGQAGAFASRVDGGAESHLPVVLAETLDAFGQLSDLLGDAYEIVGLPLSQAPDRPVGKKSRGQAAVNRRTEAGRSGGVERYVH